MGAFDDREQKDAAVKMVAELDAEIVGLKAEVATLRAEKDSPHADAKYWRELQVARESQATLSIELSERDAVIDCMERTCTDHQVDARGERDGALAVIEQVRGHIGQENTDSWHATKLRRVRELLALVPGDALAEHDRAVLEESDRDWASYFESIGSHVGDPEFTQALVVKLLRGPRPFGKAAA